MELTIRKLRYNVHSRNWSSTSAHNSSYGEPIICDDFVSKHMPGVDTDKLLTVTVADKGKGIPVYTMVRDGGWIIGDVTRWRYRKDRGIWHAMYSSMADMINGMFDVGKNKPKRLVVRLSQRQPAKKPVKKKGTKYF